ncbi:S1 RNA binding domain protein [Cytobacillus horneckiae]|uniref:RNA-binding protein S1 n=1 Tax=Cytobacillus horneckiae TaxID=549687 RepID=A0A2N0ZDF9_9BACI|nr:S1 domain-containing RNA-binding protein [Cytobacillus horneckiae]NRG44527.1 RNA-binding protein S1 [Bacillus sp. CRN 9]MBN6889735.1 RNA-binding protein S1 [Cytobacillus horneckiae]MCM3181098.1 S1 domain-containing RNA-binding protein [Cytobacillus horneckiae]MEC1154581.1 S1 domain-containing RNA-binding protein [Cytobacillus horneckiae]MED2939370.1 S1 domain-containing RNA-binding protein [Cytobacillus horneckiae]
MSIEVGSKLQGKVTGITNFGAFVELPEGLTGLVHISEVADNYVKDINDHLKVGDMVEVKVINVEKDGKIGLSIKKAKDRPERTERPERRESRGNSGRPRQGRTNDNRAPRENFETKMARFLKDSEDRLSSLKRNTESKRGGRGARRG